MDRPLANVRFLTVADPHIGLGHLYRCDALASALCERGHETQLLSHCGAGPEWLKDRAPESPWRIVMWKNDPATVRELAAQHDMVIVDAYDIAPGVHEALQAAARCPVYFDDVGENIPERGVVINGSPGAHLVGYPERAGLVLLLGTEYQVLRRPFWTAPQRVVREEITAVGVMLGGTDHSGLMNTVAATVRSAVPAEAQVIAIGADPASVNLAGVQATGRLTASGIKTLFDELDVLVTAAGQTVAEAVSCLLPTVMIQTAENQKYNVAGWSEVDCAGLIPWDGLSSFNPAAMLQMQGYLAMEQRARQVESGLRLSLQNSTSRLAARIASLVE